jgi:hypothetical protein
MTTRQYGKHERQYAAADEEQFGYFLDSIGKSIGHKKRFIEHFFYGLKLGNNDELLFYQ